MKFKHKSGICVHCVMRCDRVTSDHVFPRSWFPDATPLNVEKWQAPSCGACNNRLGKIEQRLLIAVGMGLNRDDPDTAGVPERALDSLNPAKAKNAKDRRIRLKLYRDHLRKLRPASALDQRDVFSLTDDPVAFGIPFSGADLGVFVEKIVRGYNYAKRQKYVPKDYKVTTYLYPKNGIIIERIARKFHPEADSLGPGITVNWAPVIDEPESAIISIVLYNRWALGAMIHPAWMDAKNNHFTDEM